MTSPRGRRSAPLDRPLRRPRSGRAEGADVVVTVAEGENGTARPTSDDAASDREILDRDQVPVLVLLSADWAGPSRPAPTLLRELSRRWGPSMRTLLLEDPDDELLDRWEVEHLPTWLRFVPEGREAGRDHGDVGHPLGDGENDHRVAPTGRDRGDALDLGSQRPRDADGSPGTSDSASAPASAAGSDAARLVLGTVLREEALTGRAPGGEEITHPGPWRLSHRRSGALPKHVVDAELGPDAR